jgi:hypothetical protein
MKLGPLFVAALAVGGARAVDNVKIAVDLTSAPRHIIHATFHIPAHAHPVERRRHRLDPGAEGEIDVQQTS